MKRLFRISSLIIAVVIAVTFSLPVSAVVTPAVYSETNDGYLRKSNAVYATARTATSSDYVFTSTISSTVSNSFLASTYQVDRGFLYFDTTFLLGYVVTAATLYVYTYGKSDADGESIQIQSGMPTYPHSTLVAGDYDLTYYAGDGGNETIANFTNGSYTDITLTPAGVGWINTTGVTKLCLRTTGDINNAAPTGQNFISYYTNEWGEGYQPYLLITYTALTPEIEVVEASNVSQTTAQLNALVTYNGGEPCQIRFGYGTTSKAAINFATYDTVTAWEDGYTTDDRPDYPVTGLVADTPYYYRVQIKNAIATVTSTDEETFTTELDVADVSQFKGNPSSDSISLSWVRGTGASQVLIRYSTSDYPATTADGIFVYLGDETTFDHEDLDDGTTYYYSVWGESGGNYSAVALNLVMTTTSSIDAIDDYPTGSLPGRWFQEPSESFLANLQPFYSVINGVADSWAMPRGNMWVALCLFFTFVIGAGLYIMIRSSSFSLAAMALVMGFFVTVNIMSEFWIILIVILGLGAWATRPQGV